MAARNEGVPEDRRMRFRIGINLGDVIHDETRIYGDGINIAARLEALAEPGGVLVSNTVYDQVRGKLPLTFEDLGERQVKNIEQPVRGYRRRMGGTVRVNAQLIAAGSGAHLWAEQMDVDQGTLATLQDNFGIANRLARTLSVELVNVEGRRAPTRIRWTPPCVAGRS